MATEAKLILDLGSEIPVLRMEAVQMGNVLASIAMTPETCRKLERLLAHAKTWNKEEQDKCKN